MTKVILYITFSLSLHSVSRTSIQKQLNKSNNFELIKFRTWWSTMYSCGWIIAWWCYLHHSSIISVWKANINRSRLWGFCTFYRSFHSNLIIQCILYYFCSFANYDSKNFQCYRLEHILHPIDQKYHIAHHNYYE